MDWRLIVEDGASAAAGLAADEVLAGRAGRSESLPTLRLYTYRSHAAFVGRFQTVETEVEVGGCEREGIAINRRPTGGGAILMGEDQLGVALAVAGRGEAQAARPRKLMECFSRGIVGGLAEFGIAAGFRGKNDVEVRGRKIAGLGLHRDLSGGLLFHASVLVDLDVPLMTRVLRVPFEKFSEKEMATVAGRTTTVRSETGRPVAMDDVRGAVARGFARAFDVKLVQSGFDAAEHTAVEDLVRRKYGTREWVFQPAAAEERVGTARLRTPAGTVEVHAALSGATVKAVFIRGDFVAGSEALADLEARLRWRPARQDAVAAAAGESFARFGARFGALAPEAITDVVTAAIQDGLRGADPAGAPPAPYGCFVTPEASHV